ncbi:MAG: hypothetical protein QOF62_1711 [Pyrinomonadaceae bacterium]|jgi:hypothetical protein|nr:hypothetical protein [Pyrinomonadaceae bacterium]
MGDNLNELPRSVIRIPVAGPKPNNTLVFVRGFIAQPSVVDDDLARTWVTFDTLFRIDGFLQRKADEYLQNTRISMTAYTENLAQVDDGAFVGAVDEVEGYLTNDGALKGKALIADMDTKVELTLGFYFSAWVLTYEPRAAEFPKPDPRKWGIRQKGQLNEEMSRGRRTDHDRVTIVKDGCHAEPAANSLRLEKYFADRALRRAQGASSTSGHPKRRRKNYEGEEGG